MVIKKKYPKATTLKTGPPSAGPFVTCIRVGPAWDQAGRGRTPLGSGPAAPAAQLLWLGGRGELHGKAKNISICLITGTRYQLWVFRTCINMFMPIINKDEQI